MPEGEESYTKNLLVPEGNNQLPLRPSFTETKPSGEGGLVSLRCRLRMIHDQGGGKSGFTTAVPRHVANSIYTMTQQGSTYPKIRRNVGRH